MDKICARYYYVPICTESFATLDRLNRLFLEYDNSISYKTFDLSLSEIKVDEIQFDEEKKFIGDVLKGNQALSYGKLFINGELIPGFPPSIKRIGDLLNSENIHFNRLNYISYYEKPSRVSEKIDRKNLKSRLIDEANALDLCQLCTKHSRFINEKSYDNSYWSKYENEKVNHITKSIKNNNIIAIIEYHENKPVAFVEGYKLVDAKKFGFPVVNGENGYMITCLHVKQEVSGIGIARKLLNNFEKEVMKNGEKSIQVLTFKNELNWQPISLYEKLGYKKIREIGEMSLLIKNFDNYIR